MPRGPLPLDPPGIVRPADDLAYRIVRVQAAYQAVQEASVASVERARDLGEILARDRDDLKPKNAWTGFLKQAKISRATAYRCITIYSRWAECFAVKHMGVLGVVEFLRTGKATEDEEDEEEEDLPSKDEDDTAPIDEEDAEDTDNDVEEGDEEDEVGSDNETAEEEEESDGASEVPVQDEGGAPLPLRAVEAFSQLPEWRTICRTLDEAAREIARLGKAPVGAHAHWQSAQSQLRAARKTLWAGRPAHACPYCRGEKDDCQACRGHGFVTATVYEQAKEAGVVT